jgi:hypothetical protein
VSQKRKACSDEKAGVKHGKKGRIIYKEEIYNIGGGGRKENGV